MVQERKGVQEKQVVKIGSMVTYKDPLGNFHTYTIVSERETKVLGGVVSSNTPLAKAILGRSAGDQSVVKAPGGEYSIEILETV